MTGSLGFGAYEDELVSRAWTARRSSHTPRTRHGGARRSLTVNPWSAEITHKVGPSIGLFTNSHKTDKKMHPTGQYQTGLANAAAMHVINATRTRQAISIITVHHMQPHDLVVEQPATGVSKSRSRGTHHGPFGLNGLDFPGSALRALAETRREFGQDYKEGAAVWYAAVAEADRAATGSGTARAASSACCALTSACFASTSACQRVSKNHIGIPAQQQTNNSASGMFSQNHVPMVYPPLIIQPRPGPVPVSAAPRDSRSGCAWPATSAARAGTGLGGVL